MVSVSRLEVVFSKSNVCFGGVIVAPGDGGLVDDSVWSAGTLVCPDEFKMHLLWLSIICFVLFMQL